MYQYIGTGDYNDVCLQRKDGKLITVSERQFKRMLDDGQITFYNDFDGTEIKKAENSYRLRIHCIAEIVKGFLTDDEIMTEKLREQIKKALEINAHYTSCYKLQVEEVWDVTGKNSATSGWYIVLTGCRCGKSFFVSNDMKVRRKPKDVKINYKYSLWNDETFSEHFWMENF